MANRIIAEGLVVRLVDELIVPEMETALLTNVKNDNEKGAAIILKT